MPSPIRFLDTFARPSPRVLADPFMAPGARSALGRTGVTLIVAVIGFVMTAASSAEPATNRDAAMARPATFVTSPRADPSPSRLLLNAFLVPALDSDALPLRWAHPLAASLCGPGSAVHVNGVPLRAGDPVPDLPFELKWQSNGCRPLGAKGPRYDGEISLTVFREDWGFSAIVRPHRLRVSWPGRAPIEMLAGAVSTPTCAEPEAARERGAFCVVRADGAP